jgi:cysteine desulfurase/selenocysteine lyase
MLAAALHRMLVRPTSSTVARLCCTVMTAAPTADELRAWRAGTETAGWIHLNSAGAAPAAAATHEAMVAHLELERTIGGYAAAAHLKRIGRDPRAAVAALLSCDENEIALAESAQVAWVKAFYSMEFRPGDRILCWTSEYAGNAIAFLQQGKRLGATVEVLPMRPNGLVDVEALASALASEREGGRTLVALTHVQTGESTIQPAAEVGALAQAHGVPTLWLEPWTRSSVPIWSL